MLHINIYTCDVLIYIWYLLIYERTLLLMYIYIYTGFLGHDTVYYSK